MKMAGDGLIKAHKRLLKACSKKMSQVITATMTWKNAPESLIV